MYELEPPPATLRLALALTLNPDKSDSRLQTPYITKLPLHLDSDTSGLFPIPIRTLLPLCTAQTLNQHLALRS